MHFSTSTSLSLLVCLLTLAPATLSQNAALGGGGAPPIPAPVQYPVVINGPSLATIGGKTTAIVGPFTQTFVLPLGTWAFPTPAVGSVGLGKIQGTVGKVRPSSSAEDLVLDTAGIAGMEQQGSVV